MHNHRFPTAKIRQNPETAVAHFGVKLSHFADSENTVAGWCTFSEFRLASLQRGVQGRKIGFALMRGAARSRKSVPHHCKGRSENQKTASHHCKAVFGCRFAFPHRYKASSGSAATVSSVGSPPSESFFASRLRLGFVIACWRKYSRSSCIRFTRSSASRTSGFIAKKALV